MSGIVVRPVRFTDNVKQMQGFLELVGLRPRVESRQGSWVDLVAGGGMVALHSAATSATGARPGETSLSFEADDVDALADSMKAAGVDGVTVYDEAYGRVLTCRDPLGDEIAVDCQGDDPYGYRVHPLAAPSSLRVSPVRFTDPQGPYGGFLEALGLTRVGTSDEFYASFTASEGNHGLVGLHHVYGDLPVLDRPGAVQLTFTTTEALDDVVKRLADKGFEAPITREDFGVFVTVTDPDGQEVQIHEAPSA
ncbi:MAG: VOC family protein [Nocardioidaceae bacterium]|nr:VOC family protein [Nocardioidaceae bacterium]